MHAQWAAAMSLPQNAAAYNTLILRRASTASQEKAMAPVRPFVTQIRERRGAMRLWSCLVQYEPRLADVPFIPFLCVAMSRAFPANPLSALEGSIYFLKNYLRTWLRAFPAAPIDVLKRLDDQLSVTPATRPAWLHLHVYVPDCTFMHYLFLPLRTLFLHTLPQQHWLRVFSGVICRADGLPFFYSLALALFQLRADGLQQCTDVEGVAALLLQQLRDATEVDLLLKHCERFLSAKVLRILATGYT